VERNPVSSAARPLRMRLVTWSTYCPGNRCETGFTREASVIRSGDSAASRVDSPQRRRGDVEIGAMMSAARIGASIWLSGDGGDDGGMVEISGTAARPHLHHPQFIPVISRKEFQAMRGGWQGQTNGMALRGWTPIVECGSYSQAFCALSRSQTPFGNAPFKALLCKFEGARLAKRSFATCVPKRSLGTRSASPRLRGETGFGKQTRGEVYCRTVRYRGR
jgi:hypothetical protein